MKNHKHFAFHLTFSLWSNIDKANSESFESKFRLAKQTALSSVNSMKPLKFTNHLVEYDLFLDNVYSEIELIDVMAFQNYVFKSSLRFISPY